MFVVYVAFAMESKGRNSAGNEALINFILATFSVPPLYLKIGSSFISDVFHFKSSCSGSWWKFPFPVQHYMLAFYITGCFFLIFWWRDISCLIVLQFLHWLHVLLNMIQFLAGQIVLCVFNVFTNHTFYCVITFFPQEGHGVGGKVEHQLHKLYRYQGLGQLPSLGHCKCIPYLFPSLSLFFSASCSWACLLFVSECCGLSVPQRSYLAFSRFAPPFCMRPVTPAETSVHLSVWALSKPLLSNSTATLIVVLPFLILAVRQQSAWRFVLSCLNSEYS